MRNSSTGGFFPAFSGLTLRRDSKPPSLLLDSGRSCLGVINSIMKFKRMFVPEYVCGVIPEHFARLGVETLFYELGSDFQPLEWPSLAPSDGFYLVNFFGLGQGIQQEAMNRYADALIVDNTHDPNHEALPQSWAFSNLRKNFGFADGAILRSPLVIEELNLSRNRLFQWQTYSGYSGFGDLPTRFSEEQN